MASVAKLPATKQFKRGYKGGCTPSDPARVEGTLPFGPFLAGDGVTDPPPGIEPSPGLAPALTSVLGNDVQGLSAVAAALRCLAVLYADPESGATVVPNTQEATTQYATICGAGDVGGSLLAVLEFWRSKGLKCGGKPRKIDAVCRLTPGDQRELSLAVASVRGVVLALNLKRKWYEDAAPEFVWDVTDTPDAAQIAVTVVGYTTQGIRIAWAGIMGTLTWAAYAAPGVTLEAYAVFGEEWAAAEQLAELGVDLEALTAAVAAVKDGKPPVIPASKSAAPGTDAASPAPATAGTFTGVGTMDLMGTKVQVPISGTVTGTGTVASEPAPDWFAIASAGTAVVQTARQHQWGLCAMHLAELLDMVAGVPTDEEQEQFLADLGEALAAQRSNTESD